MIVFLTEVRHKLMADTSTKEKDNSNKEKTLVEGEKNMTAVATEQLLKIIDTTFIKMLFTDYGCISGAVTSIKSLSLWQKLRKRY